ncbi:epoxide hydrolase [bacterium]|nr:epoxide hydrolase [bacterium]MCI0602330.1 epoxide hydrolase [bacterium]
MKLESFEIHISDRVLEDLQKRIAETRWPDSIRNSGWDYGTDIDVLQKLVAYWQEKFDWRREEERINSFPQFRMNIDGLRIHFIHLPSQNPEALPLIITHGWPGSFLEQLKIVPLLQDRFHIVIPSLPGYGFSDASHSPGMNPRKIAALWVQLMRALGYERFIPQGGDWGATVSTWIGLDAPQSLIGIHLNYIPGSYRPSIKEDEPLTEREKEYFRSEEEWMKKEGSYSQIQGTKPQTLAYAINDSPVGLAAWILEKAHGWSHCERGVLEHFTYEELLSNIMLYWVTVSFGSSIRLYYEARKMPVHLGPEQRVNAKTAVARFAKEEPMPPREWVERGYNVCRWTEYPAGSHFAQMEMPEVFAKEIIASAAEF